MHPLFRVQPAYDLPRLKALPLREQLAYRVAANSDSCTLPELLAAIIGGSQQLEIAEAVLARFGTITRLQQAWLWLGRMSTTILLSIIPRIRKALTCYQPRCAPRTACQVCKQIGRHARR